MPAPPPSLPNRNDAQRRSRNDEGLADNTLVIFSSDQGFYLGEHGWFDKRWIYEESLTTPLIVRWPGVSRAGVRHKAMTSVIDFPETFLEAAGLPIPSDMQGRSLKPLLQGQAPRDWRTSFITTTTNFPVHIRSGSTTAS
jgi:arylsulfatase A-like enzyme